MKKILIVIHDMEIGGAQKSLVAFLQTLAASETMGQYDISVLPLKPTGAFLHQIPSDVRVLTPDAELRWMGSHMSKQLFTAHFSLRGLIGEAKWVLKKRLGAINKQLNIPQQLWENWKSLIPRRKEHYDVAVAYIDGLPAYYVMDKVDADKKVLWVHSEYQKQEYDPGYDRENYEICDAVVTISDQCLQCIRKEFPQCTDKLHVLENISAYSVIESRSMQGDSPEFAGFNGVKLVTVGRLHVQKGIDIALEAARILRDQHFNFRWVVIGDGPEREKLREMVDKYGLQSNFLLIGARENPYPYMRAADVIVQPSRVEGKSIVLDEAKMLCKPIVSTRYKTVADSIQHGVDGWTVDIDPDAISRGIIHLWNDDALRGSFVEALRSLPKGNESELKRYIDIMF